MNTQTDLALPPAPAPRALSLETLRDLIGRGIDELEAHPRLGPLFRQCLNVPGQEGAALTAIYAVANADERGLIRTLRHLAQLLCDAEAHERRQPGKARAVTLVAPTGPELAAATAIPISLLPNNQNQETPR